MLHRNAPRPAANECGSEGRFADRVWCVGSAPVACAVLCVQFWGVPSAQRTVPRSLEFLPSTAHVTPRRGESVCGAGNLPAEGRKPWRSAAVVGAGASWHRTGERTPQSCRGALGGLVTTLPALWAQQVSPAPHGSPCPRQPGEGGAPRGPPCFPPECRAELTPQDLSSWPCPPGRASSGRSIRPPWTLSHLTSPVPLYRRSHHPSFCSLVEPRKEIQG